MKLQKKIKWYISTSTIISIMAFAIIWLAIPSITLEIPPIPQIGQPQATDSVLYEVSCYTGYESHGANGRNDNISIATYQFPQGTWVEIDGFGQRRVDTVTAKRFSHRIDIWFGDTEEDYNRCLTFGLKYLKVNLI